MTLKSLNINQPQSEVDEIVVRNDNDNQQPSDWKFYYTCTGTMKVVNTTYIITSLLRGNQSTIEIVHGYHACICMVVMLIGSK